MKWLALLVVLLSASLARANTVAVVSGEHDTFSRLVLSLPVESDWQFGRTDSGYALKIGLEDLRFDVSRVFDLIPRDRLAGIFTDPNTGNLQLLVRCDCHAIPFSLDAKTIVIDLQDGPPPATSSFELTLSGQRLPPLQAKAAAQPRGTQVPTIDPPAYDWLGRSAPGSVAVPPILPGVPVGDFAELQQMLVAQLAEGAGRGVVDLALPPAANDTEPMQLRAEESPLRVTDSVGMRVASGRPRAEMMQQDGTACIADDRLNLAEWGDETDVPAQISQARAGLVGEFDLPDQHSVAAQVRLYIYLGFGAEAAALLNAMSADEKDTPLWLAMAQIVDGEEVSENAFVGMAQCDTSAALWSLLATSVDGVEMANAAALQRAFSALPRHLRLALGPQVTDRLLALEQPDAVQGIVDAMERGTMTVQSATLLVASELDLHTGAVDTAVANAESAFDQGGVAAPDALVALVRAKVASGSTVERDLVVALAAMIDEYAGSAIAEDLAAAYLLALIGSGQYAAAMSSSDGPVPPVFWDYLAADGTDDELLQFAFVAPPIEISTASAGKIAQRLLSLGFNDAAREWRVLAGSGLPETIMENDDGGPHAIAGAPLPSTDATNENPTLPQPAVPDDGARTRRWQQDWEAIAQIESDPWNDLAVQITAPEDAADEPPLAEATRLVAGSKATREMLERLLRATAEQ